MPDGYINAVYVQGYTMKDAFIATEAPLPSRKYMFWQMVVQKHSRIIVVMGDLEEEDVSCISFVFTMYPMSIYYISKLFQILASTNLQILK